MLRELRVEEFALIESSSVTFQPGFNVLTGETGAGKSLLVDALGLAVGGRASSELVRAGAKEAVVEALFEPSSSERREELGRFLEARGLPGSDGVMVVRRIIDAAGRHRVYVNGGLATVATLAELAVPLVAICGQHEHVTLTRPAEALDLLDSFANATVTGFAELKKAYLETWEELEEAEAALALLELDPATRQEREAFLRFQISEIETVSPDVEEMAALEAERRCLAGAGRLRTLTEVAESLLYGSDEGASTLIARAFRSIDEAADLDARLAAIAEQLRGAMEIVSDAGRELGSYARRLEADPARQSWVEGRLSDLKRLARRFGGDLGAACTALEGLRGELAGLELHEARVDEASRRVSTTRSVAQRAGRKLSMARGEAASRLDDRVRDGLTRLGMSGSRVAMRVEQRELCPAGMDRVEVGLASEVDAPLRPISKVASGGELSRLLLAFRRAIAESDGIATCVFDEVDVGVGGAVGEAVGRLMRDVARGRQVLCVTHLPQLAALADHHLVVKKTVDGARTRVTISDVAGEERVSEVGRMLGGSETSSLVLSHARELLEGPCRVSSASKNVTGRTGKAHRRQRAGSAEGPGA